MDLSRDDRYWHIASFRGVAKFGRYCRHSGHGSVSIRLSSRLDHPLGRHRMPPDMNKHEDIAKALKAHLSELTGRVAEIESELRKPLSADSEDRATDLENQDALEGIENSENQENQLIGDALKRIAEGTYGVCAQCGADIDPKHLKALPNATRCISCACLLYTSPS